MLFCSAVRGLGWSQLLKIKLWAHSVGLGGPCTLPILLAVIPKARAGARASKWVEPELAGAVKGDQGYHNTLTTGCACDRRESDSHRFACFNWTHPLLLDSP